MNPLSLMKYLYCNLSFQAKYESYEKKSITFSFLWFVSVSQLSSFYFLFLQLVAQSLFLFLLILPLALPLTDTFEWLLPLSHSILPISHSSSESESMVQTWSKSGLGI